MRLAVIGAGNVGSGFARAAVAAGHDVVAAAHAEKARTVAAEIGAQAADSNSAAAEGAQVVALAVPEAAGGAPVVKAFNTVFAGRYGSPTEGGSPLKVLVAGNDAAARGAVAELASSLGFAPVEVPSLRFARSLEEIAFLNIALNAGNGWVWQSHFQLVGPPSA